MRRILVGVDTGKRQHQVAAYDVQHAEWCGQLHVPVTDAGFARFRAFLETLGVTAEQILVGVEATGHYHLTLVEDLVRAGYTVVLIDPYRAAQFRRSEGHKAKTDRIDARALARFLALQPTGTLTPTDPQRVALRELTRFRSDLVRDRTALLHRLQATLDVAFPELLGIFKDLGSRTALALLAACPTAADAVKADRADLLRLVRRASHTRLGETCTDAVLAAAKTSIGLQAAGPVLALKVRMLVQQLAALDQQIAELETAIEQAFAELGYRTADFPVGTAVSLATLIAEAGDVHRFTTSKQFLAHFGWCPADSQSGQSRNPHPRLSKAGNRHARRLIWMLAVHAVSRPGPFQDYFRRRTAAGKNKMDSVVAVGRKLLTLLYAILRTGRPYDPAFRPAGTPVTMAA